ncbi:MAG: HDIG domain-containing protein [Spirochaetes bacterium]|nr:HDIG domain-containing protein [Spirochaetota bacterium]
MLPNIVKHSEQVMNVALIIFNNLKPGINLNKNLILSGSLLHDIKKTESLTSREPHDIIGAEFVKNLGYIELAEIIEEHVILKNFIPEGPLLEKEIVFYADKRVMHDEIVSVEKRIDDILIRYGKTKRRRIEILKNKKIILEVEKKVIFNLKNDIGEILKNNHTASFN